MYETNIAYPFLHKPRSPFSKNFTIIHPGNMSQKPGSINSSFALPTSQTQGLLSLSFKSPWTRPILSLSTVTVLLQAHSTFHLSYWSIFLKSLLPSRLALLQPILHVAARVRYVYISSPKDIFHCFLEKEEGRERNIYRREMRWLPLLGIQRGIVHTWTWGLYMPGLGMKSTTQVCALAFLWETSPQTFGYGMMLRSTEPHQPGT